MVDERRDLVATFPQRRDREADDVQAVKQIFAKALVLDELFEVRVGGGDDADVDVERARFAERVDLAGLEEAEQLGLQVDVELADLVEEERAVLGGADEAGVIAFGAGEGAAAVAEQLALEQLVGDRGAVEGDKRLVCAGGVPVDGPRENLLAGAALPGDEDADVGARDASRERHELEHPAREHRVLTVNRHILNRPQGQLVLKGGPGGFKFRHARQNDSDGVHGSHRFHVFPRTGPNLHCPIPRSSRVETLLLRGDASRANLVRHDCFIIYLLRHLG